MPLGGSKKSAKAVVQSKVVVVSDTSDNSRKENWKRSARSASRSPEKESSKKGKPRKGSSEPKKGAKVGSGASHKVRRLSSADEGKESQTQTDEASDNADAPVNKETDLTEHTSRPQSIY